MMWRTICEVGIVVVAMFWNVENLFDSHDDPLKNDDEFTARAERHWTWKRFEAKRDGIAQTILAAGDAWGELPALIGLAEVENRLVVSQLVNKTLLAEAGYGYVHRESPDARGIDVALLYRKDVFRVDGVDSLRIPDLKTRDILYVRLEMPDQVRHDGNWHVFVVHMPSKRGGAKASAGPREAAMRVLQHAVDSIQSIDSQAKILVMGDFNDTDIEINGLLEPGPGEPAASRPTAPGTLKYHGRWETIDHVFLSPSLAAPEAATPAEAQPFAPPFLLETDKTYLDTKPRRTYSGPRYNGGLSDHIPLILRIFSYFCAYETVPRPVAAHRSQRREEGRPYRHGHHQRVRLSDAISSPGRLSPADHQESPPQIDHLRTPLVLGRRYQRPLPS